MKKGNRSLAEMENNHIHDDLLYVNAHINNISFPNTIEELENFIFENGMYNVENILYDETVIWTVPRSSKIGDVVLFFHAKTAIAKISALVTKVKTLPYDSPHDKQLLLEWLGRARELYQKYGGKIFAVAQIIASPEYMHGNVFASQHWRGRIYAEVGNIVPLCTPIDISEFNTFIKVSRQSAITPLPSNEFNKLRDVIYSKNDNLPAFFLNCTIGSLELSQISSKNFLSKTQPFRNRFLLEADFRSYYVDYLLKAIVGKKFWSECRCQTEGQPDYFVDNVFEFRGIYYLLEIKLNIHAERNLIKQLHQYVDAEYIYLNNKSQVRIDSFEHSYMYVLDTNSLFRYETKDDHLIELLQLDHVISEKQIIEVFQQVPARKKNL